MKAILKNTPIFLRVIFFKRLLLTAVILSGSLCALAQDDDAPTPRRGSRIINDTLKQIYGPNTSKYFYENDVFYNQEIYHPIDTLIRNFHRWTYIQANNYFYQDLGNIGTAIRPVFYQTPATIGVSSGSSVYDLYWDAEPVKYFDTKSPYSNMKVILGGKARSFTRATFSRNINPRWNFGFTYRGLLIDKQIQRKQKGDRNSRSYYYEMYTAYQSKDSAYRAFFNFRRQFHHVYESGGVNLTGQDFSFEEFYRVNAQPWLTQAETNDMRINVHLFHQYKLANALQFYHTFDRYRQRNEYLDLYNQEPKNFFDFIEELPGDTAQAVTKFKTVRNEVGIKGNILKLFYNGYYAIRHYSMTYNKVFTDTLGFPTNGNESYLGGRIALKLDSLVEVKGWAEVMQEGNYRIEGSINSKWFEASLKQLQYTPGFVQRAYRGNFDVWRENFANIESSQLNGYLHYNSKVLNVSPGITFTRLRNYVFFDKQDNAPGQQVLPVQSSGNQITASPELKIALTVFRHLTFSNQTIYTKFLENDKDALRVPEVFTNSQISYANIFFNGNLDMHAGVDVHWSSKYFAPAYDPVILQFYNQDEMRIADYPVIDLFFNAKVKRGRIFVKYHNLMQAFTKTGYLATPFYPAQRNIVDFGFDWSFYD